MSISKGGQSLKPYVGGKEVKEAYVGVQKVYSAAPPIYYAFLGSETDYVIADWCELTKGSSITQRGGVYRIAITGNFTVSDTNKITLKEIKGEILRFIASSDITTDENHYPLVTWFDISNKFIKGDGFNPRPAGNDFGLVEFNVPNNAVSCTISGIRSTRSPVYIDAIRFETI